MENDGTFFVQDISKLKGNQKIPNDVSASQLVDRLVLRTSDRPNPRSIRINTEIDIRPLDIYARLDIRSIPTADQYRIQTEPDPDFSSKKFVNSK